MHNGGEDLESDRRENARVGSVYFPEREGCRWSAACAAGFVSGCSGSAFHPPGAQLFLRTPKAQVLIDAAYGKGRVVVEVPDETSEMSGLAVGSIVFMLSPMASANSDPGRQMDDAGAHQWARVASRRSPPDAVRPRVLICPQIVGKRSSAPRLVGAQGRTVHQAARAPVSGRCVRGTLRRRYAEPAGSLIPSDRDRYAAEDADQSSSKVGLGSR